MFPDVLLPGTADVELIQLQADPSVIALTLQPRQSQASCLLCTQPSTRIHSHYCRTVADRPWAGFPVRLHIHIRKFVCTNPSCPRAIFAERLPSVFAPSAQRTLRLADDQRQLALEHGGEAGARTTARTGMAISPDTLLRLVRRTPPSPSPAPTIVGIDDWAWRKGRTYGTIIVDLEAHTVIDLLPERTAGVVQQWLLEHPSVEVISRDRAGAYADGARKGAPEAVQVADRFHLLQNLREALQRLLDRHHKVLQTIPVPESRSQPLPGAETTAVSANAEEGNLLSHPADDSEVTEAPPFAATEAVVATEALQASSVEDQARLTSRERRQARYAAVMKLHTSGLSIQAIAKQVHLSRVTVTRFVAAGSFPERAHRQAQRSILDPFIPLMTERWLAACRRELLEWGMSLIIRSAWSIFGAKNGLEDRLLTACGEVNDILTITPTNC